VVEPKKGECGLKELGDTGIAEEESTEDDTTEAKEGEFEALVYLPGPQCWPSLLRCVLKTAGDVVGNECMLQEGREREVGVGVESEE
jgi:hypothetical protein